MTYGGVNQTTKGSVLFSNKLCSLLLRTTKIWKALQMSLNLFIELH